MKNSNVEASEPPGLPDPLRVIFSGIAETNIMELASPAGVVEAPVPPVAAPLVAPSPVPPPQAVSSIAANSNIQKRSTDTFIPIPFGYLEQTTYRLHAAQPKLAESSTGFLHPE
ncbi:MAG: hypothetical protein ACI9W6_002785 [Motiliproteus sp.]